MLPHHPEPSDLRASAISIFGTGKLCTLLSGAGRLFHSGRTEGSFRLPQVRAGEDPGDRGGGNVLWRGGQPGTSDLSGSWRKTGTEAVQPLDPEHLCRVSPFPCASPWGEGARISDRDPERNRPEHAGVWGRRSGGESL